MAFYETVFITRQDLTPVQVEALTAEVKTLLEKNGGKVLKTEQWGLRTLATRIKKHKKGSYVLLNIDAPAAAIHEMERTMRINEDVLRYLSIRVDALEEGPSAMLRKGSDDDRPTGFFGSRSGGDRSSSDRGGDRGFRPRPPRTSSEGEAA